MKTLTVRLPDALVAQIEAESRKRNISKSDLIRERLSHPADARPTSRLDSIADLIGSVEIARPDLSARRKHHLSVTSHDGKRPG